MEDLQDFIQDPSPDAYEKLVDRLLTRPSYGEHWARMWLDLARYADSAGYADDPPRTIWLYRDYVIQSLNADKPFDQFTIEQLAGDLLPSPSNEQIIATAFHRNTLTNNEGGTSDEEFRNVAVVDRVNTTMAVWMGTTIACAQCHNHKYDPITQAEYFRFFAILNNTEDADRSDEAPVLSVFSREKRRSRQVLQSEIAKLDILERLLHGRSKSIIDRLPLDEFRRAEWGRYPSPKTGPGTRSPAGHTLLPRSDRPRVDVGADVQAIRRKRTELTRQLADIKPDTVPIMRELREGQRRKTHIQYRGNFLDLGPEVKEGTPEAFSPLPGSVPPNRLALAKWLVDANNPLTARVIANRAWEQLFGIGIVASSEEFGAQGDLPVHPELLDWLATELIRLRWDMKSFVKLLVTSAAYRQSSRVSPELQNRDPDNRLLARGPRFRLSAEMVRDQAQFVGGLLSTKMFGQPVKPPQPAQGLAAAFGSGIDWQTSAGDDRHRRGLYTMWRRSNPYPSMVAFDAPNREVCTVRRTRTNTPLQALVTLNDPVYMEAAQALARRTIAEADPTTPERARRMFRICLSRQPSDTELTRLVGLFEEARNRLRPNPEQARELATDPIGPLPADQDAGELAAWTVVGNVLLNLDEMLMKR